MLWGLYAAEAAAIRIAAADRSGVPTAVRPHGAGHSPRGTSGFLRHPLFPAALPLGGLALTRLGAGRARDALARAAALGALAAVLPVRTDATPATVAAGAGVSGSLALTLSAVRARGVGGVAPRRRGDRVRAGLGLGLLVGILPWALADAGVYVGDVPLLRNVFLSRQRLPPGAVGPAVHLGHHHGMDGALLAATGLALSRQLPAVPPDSPRWPLSWTLAGLTVYGLARAAEDGWYEQVVKRGRTAVRLPTLVRHGRPVGGPAWLGVLGATWLVERSFRWEAAGPAPVVASPRPEDRPTEDWGEGGRRRV